MLHACRCVIICYMRVSGCECVAYTMCAVGSVTPLWVEQCVGYCKRILSPRKPVSAGHVTLCRQTKSIRNKREGMYV